jgi:hypothetical protein
MGCSCGKPKPGPLGAASTPVSITPTPPTTPSGGLSSRTQSFTLISTSGSTQKFTGSLLEAQAALVRSGGGSLKPVS